MTLMKDAGGTAGTTYSSVVASVAAFGADLDAVETESAASTAAVAVIKEAPLNVRLAENGGALVNGIADDAAAIATAYTRLPQSPLRGELDFGKGTCVLSSFPNSDDSVAVKLLGHGSSNRGNDPLSVLMYTGTGTSPFISAKRSDRFMVENMDVRYNNSGFTGHLFDLRGGATDNTADFHFKRCMFGGQPTSIRTAASLVRLLGSHGGVFSGCTFMGAVNAVRGNEIGMAVTGVAATDIFTATAHEFFAGQTVTFSGLTGGTGISTVTTYWIINPTANTFQVSTTQGGAALNFTTDLTVGTVASAQGVNGLTFDQRCKFWDTASFPIRNPSSGWLFDGPTIEPISNGEAAFAYVEATAPAPAGLTIREAWAGDVTLAGGEWIRWRGSGLHLEGGWWGCEAGGKVVVVQANNCRGIEINGVSASGNGGADALIWFQATTGHTGVRVMPGTLTNIVKATGTLPGGLTAYAASNVTPDRTYDADATSTAELADIVGTMIEDLKIAGVLT